MKIKATGDIGKPKKRSAMAVSSAERNALFIQWLSKAQTLKVPIEFYYPINDVRCAFGTPDGFFNKPTKL